MNRKQLIEEIDIQISEFKNILKSENNHDILEEDVLDLLWDIEEKVFQIIGGTNNSTPIQKEIIFQSFMDIIVNKEHHGSGNAANNTILSNIFIFSIITKRKCKINVRMNFRKWKHYNQDIL